MTTRRLLFALAAAATLAGCSIGRATPHIRYYTLAVPGEPPAHLAAPVVVGAFTCDQPYATERIAYRSSPYRLDYYTYHRWAADPRNLIRTAARDYFERGAGTTGVPFEIEGNIRRLEEVDDVDTAGGGEHGGADAALALDVRVARGGAILLERAFSETERAASRRPEDVAAALSRALQRVLDEITRELAAAPATAAPSPRHVGR